MFDRSFPLPKLQGLAKLLVDFCDTVSEDSVHHLSDMRSTALAWSNGLAGLDLLSKAAMIEAATKPNPTAPTHLSFPGLNNNNPPEVVRASKDISTNLQSYFRCVRNGLDFSVHMYGFLNNEFSTSVAGH